jgi:hypothetical protein
VAISLLVRVPLPQIFVICNCFTYTCIAEEWTWTYSKHISRDRYPASLLARRSDLQKIHVTSSLSTVVTSPRTRKTQTYSKHISRDRYPASLLARPSDLQKVHVTSSLSTVVTSPQTRKTQIPLLLHNLATDCSPKICIRGNLFTNTLPSNGCTCNVIK